MKLLINLLAFFALSVSFGAYAGGFAPPPEVTLLTTPGKSQTDTENRAYAGLVWTLQEQMSWIPDLSIGFRSLRVKSSDSVNGAEISARIKLKDGISFDSTRLSYVGGERDILGNIGIGYSATNSSLLGTVAVQGAYSRLGTDYQFNGNRLVPYLEVLTVDKPNKVRSKSATVVCSNELLSVEDCFAESDARLKYGIKQIAKLENGFKIYSFKYKSRIGDYVGVMAQDLIKNPKWSKAVVKRSDGYYLVNYKMLGIKMNSFENWKKNGIKSIQLN